MGLESPHHECAVFGIISPGHNVSQDIYYALLAQQNRGQENSGMAVFDRFGRLNLHKDLGLVNSVFTPSDIEGLPGEIGLGHNRYGTTGSPSVANGQPFVFESDLGQFAFVTNGNVFNAADLKIQLLAQGVRFDSSSDSEVIGKWIARATGETFLDKIKAATPDFQGSYSCIISTDSSLIAFRDPYGFWPLNYGSINENGFAIASESNALNKLNSSSIGEIPHGGILIIDQDGLKFDSLGQKEENFCSFEFFYFSDGITIHLGRRVAGARFDMGRQLAREHPFNADLVCPVPETARPIAEGYAYESGIPLMSVLIRNRHLGRTFIEPSQRSRDLAAGLKYGVVEEEVRGKRVVVADDSIVRGTTTKKTINLFKKAGAREIDVVIAAPPIKAPCYFGIDTANKDELIAARFSVSQIRDFIEADNLGFLSLQGGLQAIGGSVAHRLCVSCFTGEYQMEVPLKRDKFVLEHI
jgi:amidophosphoribosyltransferase